MRPTAGRVRESLFSILQAEIPDATFLDLFAGVGAVGLEALSRGAKSVTLVENHPRVLNILHQNVQRLDQKGQCSIREKDAFRFSQIAQGEVYSLVYADPPYSLPVADLWAALSPLVAPGGTAVLQISSRERPLWLDQAQRHKVYGESLLAFFYNS